ncbi:MAG: RDD family protein, partial [Bacteroidetes bacterium]
IDGYQASLGDFFTRWIFRIVDFNLLGPVFGSVVALIAIVSSSKNQRLGDMTAGTSVITLKNSVNISHTILEDLTQDYVPTYPSVIKLSDNDARIIKDTFKTAIKSKDYKTLIKLRAKIIEVIQLKEVKHNTDHEFIDVVLKDYNYYTQNM